MTGEELIEVFEKAALAIQHAVEAVPVPDRGRRTDRPGQYEIDVIADRVVLDLLATLPVEIVSEESGRSGSAGADLTIVVDPIDGSTNAARDLPYWGASFCTLDRDGMLASLVANQATGVCTVAVRGRGAYRDGARIHGSGTQLVEESFVALSSFPDRMLPWSQFRTLGSVALALCDVAAGFLDGFVDGGSFHAPWDYLGALLPCEEAGVLVVDSRARPLVTTDLGARRQLVAAGTRPLLESLRTAVPQ